ncbi:hypothetical protein CAPTEDRAFT_203157 [Capitella teleta]|uniref:Uncharacterized protein n=1 Tax=Capitella teleta TaxID=283909 RepID=R7V709_CAPTE|nr:hypothetical protein CAPTEDRAFT_203157 [Capitella teleta]|eukprot:ELU14359.1 hypothetical protein CAPTEDRAFT_203157 [Capitella teleta]
MEGNDTEEEFQTANDYDETSTCVEDTSDDDPKETSKDVRPTTQERTSMRSSKDKEGRSSPSETEWEHPPPTLRRFRGPPRECPLTLCFDYPHTYLTHRYVFDQIKTAIQNVPYGNVSSLQFCDRNVLHNDRLLCNRWVITLSSIEARDHLLRTGIKLLNNKVRLMPFDDVIGAEYKRFARLTNFSKARVHLLTF